MVDRFVRLLQLSDDRLPASKQQISVLNMQRSELAYQISQKRFDRFFGRRAILVGTSRTCDPNASASIIFLGLSCLRRGLARAYGLAKHIHFRTRKADNGAVRLGHRRADTITKPCTFKGTPNVYYQILLQGLRL